MEFEKSRVKDGDTWGVEVDTTSVVLACVELLGTLVHLRAPFNREHFSFPEAIVTVFPFREHFAPTV